MFVGFGIVMFFISAFFDFIIYALCAYCLYSIGTRNGVKNPWIAFIPILQFYIIGSICEEYELFGVCIKRLEWVMCGVFFLLMFWPYLHYISPLLYRLTPLVIIAAKIFTALVMHKFYYLFEPRYAVIQALISMFGVLPLTVVLFFVKDKPMQMSAGAYPYPFVKR